VVSGRPGPDGVSPLGLTSTSVLTSGAAVPGGAGLGTASLRHIPPTGSVQKDR
jgi:hypothetical protein